MKVGEILRENNRAPTYYFGYGMLTNPTYMSNAKLIGVAELRNFELTITSYANVEQKTGSNVYGALWEIDRDFISTLDKIEGYPTLYDRKTYPVYLDGKKYTAEIYFMTPVTVGRSQYMIPEQDYIDMMEEGYQRAGIPLSQIDDALDALYYTDEDLS
jgi:gamma-glutamylcyclotransferase (GGCT)/AIG2-like uncharacterized protein YtfP